jgi:hypothetical protein
MVKKNRPQWFHRGLIKLQEERYGQKEPSPMVFGFGLYYHSRHWNNETEWENWESIYPILKI